MSVDSQIKKLKFNSHGLLPVIIQDYKSSEVLMFAYMNREALKMTLTIGKVHFFSRSRQKIWFKGEVSGHYQIVRQILVDCDLDTLLIKVHQRGGACHEGYRSCFFKALGDKGKSIKVIKKKLFDPKKIYKKK